MIQDIYPSVFNNSFENYEFNDNSCFLYFDNKGRILVNINNGNIEFNIEKKTHSNIIYLFSIDKKKYFLSISPVLPSFTNSSKYYSMEDLRKLCNQKDLFVAFTAYHLWRWYNTNQYCGHCQEKTEIKFKERVIKCPKCGNIIYPRINPAVIVGIIKEDCLLITKYKKGYSHNALVAGFTEIGETLEQTVEREVMEEVGIKVKNIRYYKSQPWGIAQDILVGFFCEVDGDSKIKMDRNELKYAQWVKREYIELQPDNLSLTNEMMQYFKNNIKC